MPAIQDSPSDAASKRRPRSSSFYRAIAAVSVIAIIAIGSFALGRWLDGDDGLEARQQEVAERGGTVMPFDLEATTHVFAPTDDGGVQTVVADDPADNEQIVLIRSHLRDEVAAFRSGDFGDPATIHGHEMPGLSVLEARSDSLTITYQDRPDGGEVFYRSSDPVVVQALHDWFAAQLKDHGDDAESG
jgi:hypothetical protein